jgi:hypothetical protein
MWSAELLHQKTSKKCKLLSIPEMLDITKWTLLKMYLVQNVAEVCYFCVNLRDKAYYSVRKWRTKLENNKNSKIHKAEFVFMY